MLGQASALLHEQHQEAQRQPRGTAGEGGRATGGGGGAGVVQQMQVPAFGGQRQALPQHRLRQCGIEQAHHAATIGKHVFSTRAQWLQRAVGVLAGVQHFAALIGAQRAQQAVAPAVTVGQEHHVMVVAGQHHVRAAQPFLFQRRQLDLDHHHAEPLAIFLDGLRQVVAGYAGGHADAVEAAAALRQCLPVVGAVAVVLADVAGRLVPVAGRHCHPVVADQGQG